MPNNPTLDVDRMTTLLMSPLKKDYYFVYDVYDILTWTLGVPWFIEYNTCIILIYNTIYNTVIHECFEILRN